MFFHPCDSPWRFTHYSSICADGSNNHTKVDAM